MNPFKAGDKVITQISDPGYVTKDKVYTVKGVRNNNVVVAGTYENGQTPERGLNHIKFKLYQEPPTAGPEVVTERSRSGAKDDGGKLDVTLLFDDMPHALYEVVKVLQWAVTEKKPVPYERGSWQTVPELQRRYRAAQLRHTLNAAISRLDTPAEHPTDAETGLLELAHIATSALFQLEMVARELKEKQNGT